jgi:succinate-semialdehyde dehydrogenase/glutarate-semialdehyde dehydrogenase
MAVAGRFNNNGQCIASKRFIAVAAVADEFWKSLPIVALKVGDQWIQTHRLDP